MAGCRNLLQSLVRLGQVCLFAAVLGFSVLPVARAVAQPVQSADVEAIMAKAEAALAKAGELGHAWSSTRPLLDEARTNLESGDLDEAMANAQRALVTAERAIDQARLEQEAWRARVPGS